MNFAILRQFFFFSSRRRHTRLTCDWSSDVCSSDLESFNGRLRDELLNETLFTSIAHARQMLASFQDDYNTVRPHSGLGNLPPAAYAKLNAPRTQRAGALELPGGSAPRPVASPSHTGSNDTRALLIAG